MILTLIGERRLAVFPCPASGSTPLARGGLHQFQRRDMACGLSQQVHGPEPDRQRPFGGSEDRAGGGGRLMSAATTLPVHAADALEHRAQMAVAAWADETLRAGRTDQRGFALGVGAVAMDELGRRQARLE